MVTVVQGNPVAESRIVTDGRARRVQQDDCSGTEVAHWSADGRRVFLNSDLVCEGNLERKVSGVFVITATNAWLSVQSIAIGDETATRTVSYIAVEPNDLPPEIRSALRADRATVLAARAAARSALNVRDVEEAVDTVDPNVVQEWLSLTDQSHLMPEPEVETSYSASTASSPYTYSTTEYVRVVERPVIHNTYINVVRSCWDPFYSGFTVGHGYGLGFGVTVGTPYCGHRYYSRYSPWGYDLYGWRFLRAPLVIVRTGPHVIRRGPIIIRKDRGPYRYRYTTRHEGPATPRQVRDDYDRGRDRHDSRGRVTRSGYSSGYVSTGSTDRWTPAPRRTASTPSAASGRHPGNDNWTVPASRASGSRATSPAVRRTSSPAPSRSSEARSSDSRSGDARSTSSSRGTAKARGK